MEPVGIVFGQHESAARQVPGDRAGPTGVHGVGNTREPDGPAGRRYQHGGANPVRPVERQRRCDFAAHRVADDDDRSGNPAIDECAESPSHVRQAVGGGRLTAAAEAGQVDGNDPVMLSQRIDDRSPGEERLAESVEQQQRGIAGAGS